jgi:serine/threonine protein kinase
LAGRRIRRVDLGGEVAESKAARPTDSTGLSAALASPRGVLVTVPLLVALLGVSLTLVGQRALENTSLSMARDRFIVQTAFASERIAFALARADFVLDRTRDAQLNRTSSESAHEFALVLRNLIAGRPGMTQVYVGFPDGTFQGVYVGDDGELRFQESRVGAAGGKFHHYRFGQKSLDWERDEPTDYDPRKRDWWTVAVKARTRAWTEPYPFFTTRKTGVTRVEPLLKNDGSLHSVMAVDYDATGLSTFMARAETMDIHTLVFTDAGVVLAYPRAQERIAKLKPTTHALNYRDIDEPLLNAFFGMTPAERADAQREFVHFDVGKETMLATVAPIGDDTLPRWHVAILVSEKTFLSALKTHRQKSLAIAVLALALAVLAAWFFARNIVRARRAVAQARAAAEMATRQVMDLGSYTLLECLGKGGMGEVWRAEHRLLARQAAIKLIKSELAAGAEKAQVEERFKREAKTIASLRSRNTVEVFDYGITGEGTLFFVMELLDGIDLETLTQKYGPQPAARVVPLLIQACNSLAEAHDAGLVHRDIKPANIFVCRAADEVDVVKVLDFGLVLARAREGRAQGPAQTGTPPERLTQQGAYLGTPTFIAPEQALGLAVDARADLYALGCVGWWLLTGKLVFETTDTLAALAAHLTHVPPPLRPLVPGSLPPELEKLIEQCLAKSPADRPGSARELSRALRAIRFEASEAWTLERGEEWWRTFDRTRPSSSAPEPNLGTMDTVLGERAKLS